MGKVSELHLCWYFSVEPSADDIFQIFNSLSETLLLPIEKTEFFGNDLKTIRCKFSKENLAKCLQIKHDSKFFLNAISIEDKNNINHPYHSLTILKMTNGNTPSSFALTVVSRLENSQPAPELIAKACEIVSSKLGAVCGFGFVSAKRYTEINYSVFLTRYVKNPNQIFREMKGTINSIKEEPSRLVELTKGQRLRSVFRYNFVPSNLTNFFSEFLPVSSNSGVSFFLIEGYDKQKAVFERLKNADKNIDLNWVDIENYIPSDG